MPIFPTDMTGNGFQLAKINVSDGISSHRVGKVNGFDGTAMHLIYSAEENVFQHGVSCYSGTGYSHHGDMTFDGSSLVLTATSTYGANGGVVNAYTKAPFDLSGVDALTLTALSGTSVLELPNCTLYVGVVQSMPTTNGSWLPSGWKDAGTANSMRVINAKEVSAKLTKDVAQTVTLDVSDLSGSYYVTFCAVNNHNYYMTGGSFVVTVTNAILT